MILSFTSSPATVVAAGRAAPGSEAEGAREALRRAVADLDAAERDALPYGRSQALAQVARCYRGLQETEAAETQLMQALRWGRLACSTDHVVDLLCELSETAAEIAEAAEAEDPGAGRPARDRARDRVFEAAGLAGRVSDPQWEIQVLLRISDVLDRCGDHEDAAALQVRALQRIAAGYVGTAEPARPIVAADTITQ
jgi:tetratricopeptide (TPR) repeat protein